MSSETRTRSYQLRKRADAMQNTRRRIAEAAMELHESIGPARTTISAVAERAGVQRQTVYRHFPTEEALIDACSGHYSALNPLPDPEKWPAIADPAQRLESALDALYAHYESTQAMYTNILRDETLVAPVAEKLAEFRGYLDDVAAILTAGWGVRGKRRAVLRAALRHAVDFHTWRSLASAGGVTRAEVIELASAMVRSAARAGPDRRR